MLALFFVFDHPYPKKLAWTWELFHRLYARITNEESATIRGPKKDPNTLNKCLKIFIAASEIMLKD